MLRHSTAYWKRQVVPLYYARDQNGVPHGWIRMVKEAIRSIVPVFCACRMLKEYTERMYEPASRHHRTTPK